MLMSPTSPTHCFPDCMPMSPTSPTHGNSLQVRYGLASSVWTSDHARALRCCRAFDFGCVWINAHIPLVAEMPHGGFKQSG